MPLRTTFLKYAPLLVCGFILRIWAIIALMLSTSLRLLEAHLADDAVDVAAGVVAELDLAGGVFADGVADVRRHGAGLGRGHQALGAEHLTEPADEPHHVRGGDGDVEIGEVLLLDLRHQFLPAGPDRAGVEGGGDQVLGAERDHALGLADAVRQRQRAADHLVRLLGVDAQGEDQLDRLVELGGLERS